MSAAVCPSCGVAIIPGYTRCPKCRKPLPRRTSTVVEGGTALESQSRWPLLAAIGAVLVAVGFIVFFAMRGDDKPKAAAPVTETPTQEPTGPETDTGGSVEVTPNQPVQQNTQQATGPNPTEVAAELERQLKRQRLWSTVNVNGARVDVRSGSCSDAAMGPMLDGAAASFKAAGLTQLRCVEQSGRVISTRDL